MPGINLLAVFVAGIVSACLNILWYSRLLFGRKRTEVFKKDSAGVSRAEKEGHKILLAAPVTECIIAYVIAYLVALTGSYSFLTILELILWIWLGFAVAVLSNCVFREGRAWSEYLISISYRLISWMIMGIIIVYFSRLI